MFNEPGTYLLSDVVNIAKHEKLRYCKLSEQEKGYSRACLNIREQEPVNRIIR
jgi:hypothetical protein